MYGVKIKTTDSKRAMWLTNDGGLTSRIVHAGRTTQERAQTFAEEIAKNNADTVEWARAEAFNASV